MSENTEFVILVTGRYHWLVKPLLYFYEKYMPVPLTFFSDRPIEGCNAIEVFPHGIEIYREPCGRLVKDALQKLDKPLLMFGYMDMLPKTEVYLQFLAILERYMLDHANVARCNLWADAQWQIRDFPVIAEYPGLSIHKLPGNDPGLGSIGSTHLAHALWSKDFLVEFIEDQWTFDMIESKGPEKFCRQQRWYSIGTFPGLVNICHLCFTADQNEVRLSTIPDVRDREYVSRFIPEGRWIG